MDLNTMGLPLIFKNNNTGFGYVIPRLPRI
jgi:hypothetical protein